MGSLVEANCKCGYKDEFMIGGGMLNFKEVCYFPAFCRKCKNIVDVNMLDNQLTCPDCGEKSVTPYDQESLVSKAGKNKVAEWNVIGEVGRSLVLTDGPYFCPACEEYTLSFKESADFD
jgi:hypothetical protein